MLFIYDNFIQQGVVDDTTAQRWTRRYFEPGEFELTLPFGRQARELLKPGRVVYKRDTDEAAFIEDITISSAAQGDEKMTVSGLLLSGILNRRIINYIGGGNLSAVITALLSQNITNPANQNRRIPNFRLADISVPPVQTGSIEFENENLLTAISSLAKKHNVGFAVRYNLHNKTFDFHLYQGRQTNAVFSRALGNVSEREYRNETREYKNTVLVGEQFVYNQNAGLERREVYISAGSTETTAEAAAETAASYLLGREPLQGYEAVINTLSEQFIYRRDWDLGDNAICKEDAWGVYERRPIIEITEFTDGQGRHLEAVFGDKL